MPWISEDIERIQIAKNFIDSDMSRHHSIPEIATHAKISATKLKAGFRELFGMGLFHYLIEQRMQKAKYLLENTDKPLKIISHNLGYKHISNFIIAFKKRFGVTPNSWRNKFPYF